MKIALEAAGSGYWPNLGFDTRGFWLRVLLPQGYLFSYRLCEINDLDHTIYFYFHVLTYTNIAKTLSPVR